MKQAFASLLAGILVVACNRDLAVPTSVEITEKEATAFADVLFKQMQKPCDPIAAEKLLDLEVLLANSLKGGLAIGETVMRAELKREQLLARVLCTLLPEGTMDTFLRVQQIQGKPQLLFRRLTPGGGMNFLSFVLSKRSANAPILVADWQDYMSGELSSTAMRNFMQQQKDKGTGLEALAAAPKMKEATRLVAEQKFPEALVVLDSLPAAFKEGKSMQLLRVAASATLPPDQYRSVMSAFEAKFPNDPALLMVSIDSDTLAKRWTEVLASLNKLQSMTGGDAYLSALSAYMLLQRDNPTDKDEAKKLALSAASQDPSLELVWSIHIQVHAKLNDAAGLAAGIQGFHDSIKKSLSKSTLSNVIAAELLASPEIKALEASGVLLP